MGRGVVLFSVMIAAGLVQMAPAAAQSSEPGQDKPGDAAPSSSAPPSAPSRMPVFVNVPPIAPPVVEPKAEPKAAPKVAEAKPEPRPAPVVERDYGAEGRAMAERDLAPVPDEGPRPVIIDPNAARRAVEAARQAAARARVEPEVDRAVRAAAKPPEPVAAPVARPVKAAEAPAPAPAPAVEREARPVQQASAPVPEPAPEPAGVPIEQVAERRDAGGYDGDYEDREHERRPVYAGEERDPQPIYEAPLDEAPVEVAEERAAPAGRDLREREARAAADIAEPAPPPVRDVRERQARAVDAEDERLDQVADVASDPEPAPLPERRPARPVYADQLPVPAPAYPRVPVDVRRPAAPLPSSRPVYADELPEDRGYGRPGAQDGRPVYAEDAYPEAAPLPDARDGSRWALNRRDPTADYGRGGRFADRGPIRACSDDRAYRLQQRIRRQAEYDRIDWRTAEDLEDELGHVDDVRRSYCSSGMNEWREERLSQLYAQVEDRIRYEEDRSWGR